MTLLTHLPEADIEVHQLLSGRDIAVIAPGSTDKNSILVYEFARSMANFVYLIVHRPSGTATVIDPCWDVIGIFDYAHDLGVRIVTAVFTHRHPDHVGGRVPAYVPRAGNMLVPGILDVHNNYPECIFLGVGVDDIDAVVEQTKLAASEMTPLAEGSIVPMGAPADKQAELKVIHTPGHTPGSICFHLRPLQQDGISPASSGLLFTGDTLFIGSSGRVDLPEGSASQMSKSLARLALLPDDLVVCTGHNYSVVSNSTIGKEKVHNMAMLQAIAVEEAAGQGKHGLNANPVAAMLPLPDYVAAMRRAVERVEAGKEESRGGAQEHCSCFVHTTPGFASRV